MMNLKPTPQEVYFSRREILKAAGVWCVSSIIGQGCTSPRTKNTEDYTNIFDELGDPLTPLEQVRSYGNYYEFTRSHEGISQLAQNLSTSPWNVEVGGLVENPQTFSIEDLEKFEPSEHIYRFRCLEAWSFVIPWRGFPLKRLIDEVVPLPEARFVRFEALYDPDQLPAQNEAHYEDWLKTVNQQNIEFVGNMSGMEEAPYTWPYAEGLRLDEALHDLTLLAMGMYGQPLFPENGAPLRLVVPWKYSYKSIKAITKIELVSEQPLTFWNTATPKEFGFYGNVNPDVSHPRWNQTRELRLAGDGKAEILATLPFNGYQKQVAHLYDGMDLRIHY